MTKKTEIRKNRFIDSVSLMSASDTIKKMPGIDKAELVMGTPINLETLTGLGFTIPAGTGSNDLVIAISGENDLTEAFETVNNMLERGTRGNAGKTEKIYRSLDDIDPEKEPYDLVQISLNGKYAVGEARKALDRGLDVFIFSDNVPIEDELELKKYGTEKGLLVMGPDCGVGLINGVCLGAGSIIQPGPIGIVGASGSGAQEVACIIEKCGLGLTALIGTGGHDLYPQIGGIMMLAGMKRLAADPNTKVIVLVSKLADSSVMERVLLEADKIEKETVVVFLGAEPSLFSNHKVHAAYNLEEAALKAVSLAKGKNQPIAFESIALEPIAFESIGETQYAKMEETIKTLGPQQRYFRGLYCGGTFTEEALIYFSKHNPGVQIFSNLKNRHSIMLDDIKHSRGHTVLDLGAENFTFDSPHPVFNIEKRLERFNNEARDPQTAVVLLDFITGPGVHRDPVRPFAHACRKILDERKGIVFIASICGSKGDPQQAEKMKDLLSECGVIVANSNYQSAKLASKAIDLLERRNKC